MGSVMSAGWTRSRIECAATCAVTSHCLSVNTHVDDDARRVVYCEFNSEAVSSLDQAYVDTAFSDFEHSEITDTYFH